MKCVTPAQCCVSQMVTCMWDMQLEAWHSTMQNARTAFWAQESVRKMVPQENTPTVGVWCCCTIFRSGFWDRNPGPKQLLSKRKFRFPSSLDPCFAHTRARMFLLVDKLHMKSHADIPCLGHSSQFPTCLFCLDTFNELCAIQSFPILLPQK